ncbi:hypothetical protein LXN10_04855 [Arcobacter sp. KX21116]|uniref:DUF411 domain-containing protein n=1 Tax=Arcobacter iocasae TaxID=2906515 RepID=UPI0035D3F14C
MKKLVFISIFASFLCAQSSMMQIYKPVTGSCPQDWIEEMTKEVKEVNVVSLMNVKNLKKEIGIPKEIQSCNTSIIDDYVFEGNVPARAIKDFFKTKPKNAIGLSLPAYENDKSPKTVFVLFEDKTYKIFGKY